MNVADLVERKAPFVYETDPATKARAVIRESGVRVLPVLDSQRRVKALLSRTDILTVTSTKTTLTAGQIASGDWFPVHMQDDAQLVLKRMLRQGVWYVPVVADAAGSYAGIFGIDSILEAFHRSAEAALEKLKVEDVMTRDVLTCEPEDKSTAVWTLMLDRGIAGIPVVKGKKVVGIITQKDLIDSGAARVGAEGGKGRFSSPPTVAKLMRTPALTVKRSASLNEAIKLMLVRRIGRLPVVDEGGAIMGIVDREDLVRAVLGVM